MQNLHRHSSYSNIFTKADSSGKNEPYAKRSVELGHKVISSVEHGWQGYYFETFELAHEYGLKCVIGSEAYWVPNRFESDSSNRHILILAKNNNGREYINDILSEASLTGYYYKPRIDIELLKTLPKDDVFVTTACIAFGYNHMEESERYIDELHEYFGDNFCLEIQYHNTDKQKMWNEFLATMHDKYDIAYIVGYDSHYIFETESAERDDLLEAKDMHYADEVGWFMDYPTDEEAVDRFLAQGIFNLSTIKKAMDKTDIALTFDDYDDVPIFQKDVKLPTLYPELSQEQKNKIYTKLITKQFKKYMKNIPESEYDRYFQGIKEEVQTYKDTKMTDYPLLDYEIVKDAVAHGGVITSTGRGSAASFMTNTLCGFSQVDRFTSAIKLYPERFMSTTRILETKSLPDIDLNVGTVSIFEDSQKRILGDNHVYPMIAFGTLKKRAAFKIYAKAKGLEFELANTISAQIGKYDEAVKNASDDEKDMIDINDYVDIKYQEYLEESKKYWGIISDKKKAPSAYLLYQGDIRREIGLIKCKSDSTKKEYICCVIDGAIAEKYKFLKNDILKVDSVLLIKKVFDRIGIPQFDTNTLIKKVTGDQKVWDIYKNGYTVGINQVEQEGSRQKCMRYKPHNVSELSAFVAAVRPGFKSMYSRFESREHFEYGIPSLDNLIQTKEMPVSYILYQEQVMSILNYAGFPMDQCYGIIKAIAKKHPEKVKPLKEKFIDGFSKKLILEDNLTEEDAQKNAERVWTIVNDNCGYSFNCVSGNTKIIKGASNHHFNPTIEEMYKIKNDIDYAKKTNHLPLHKKYNRLGYGQALSLFDDGKLRPNNIVGIYEAGIRQTYKIQTESGCSLICTDNHRFPTPNGKKRLDELKIGDMLYCKGEYSKKKYNYSYTDGNFELNYPQKGEQGFQKNENGAFVKYHDFLIKNKNNRNNCELCGAKYSEEKRFEVHHKDFNRHNNEPNNFQWLCCSCHKKMHYKGGRKKRYDNGIDVYLSPVISIEPYSIEMTYDVEMESPAHTFVSESGLVTSNSSHAYCMALDSLYQAWQKAYYPYEFYEVLLQHFSDKGKKDKVAALKAEMKRAFGISEGSYSFRNDHRVFRADEANRQITSALLSIKGIGDNVADDLYKLSSNDYVDFISLLVDIQSTSIKKNQLITLIKLDLFSEFGNPNELLREYDIFSDLYGRTVISKANIAYPVEIIRSCCDRETEKQFRSFNDLELIRAIINGTEKENTSIIQQTKYELELLGYIKTIVPKLDEDFYIVQELQGYNKNIAVLYRLQDGDIWRVKVRAKLCEPLEVGFMIKVINVNLEPKWRKDTDGKWIQLDEKELILKKYSHIT